MKITTILSGINSLVFFIILRNGQKFTSNWMSWRDRYVTLSEDEKIHEYATLKVHQVMGFSFSAVITITGLFIKSYIDTQVNDTSWMIYLLILMGMITIYVIVISTFKLAIIEKLRER